MKANNKKAVYAILFLGIALMIVGLVMIIGGADHTSGSGLSRASTSIKFGADFYTTSAQATGLAANTLIDLYDLISTGFGIFFMFMGALDICITCLVVDFKALNKKEELTSEEDAAPVIENEQEV